MSGIVGQTGGWKRNRSGQVFTVHPGDLVIVRGGGGFIVEDDSLIPVNILKVDGAAALVEIRGENRIYGDQKIFGTLEVSGLSSFNSDISVTGINHTQLTSPIEFSEVGNPALDSRFTAISVIGAINELMGLYRGMTIQDSWNFAYPQQSPSNGLTIWFSTYFPYTINRLLTFVNGMLQYKPIYNENFAGNGVTFSFPVIDDADVLLFYSDRDTSDEWIFELSPTSPGDGIKDTFYTTEVFESGKIMVFVSGLLQAPNFYAENIGLDSITFVSPVPSNLEVRFFYFKSGNGSNWSFEFPVEGLGDGVRKRFSTMSPFKEGKILVFINGLQQEYFDYSGISSWVEFPEAPHPGANIFFIYIKV